MFAICDVMPVGIQKMSQLLGDWTVYEYRFAAENDVLINLLANERNRLKYRRYSVILMFLSMVFNKIRPKWIWQSQRRQGLNVDC